jgi:hypothetical protein
MAVKDSPQLCKQASELAEKLVFLMRPPIEQFIPDLLQVFERVIATGSHLGQKALFAMNLLARRSAEVAHPDLEDHLETVILAYLAALSAYEPACRV